MKMFLLRKREWDFLHLHLVLHLLRRRSLKIRNGGYSFLSQTVCQKTRLRFYQRTARALKGEQDGNWEREDVSRTMEQGNVRCDICSVVLSTKVEVA